MEYNSLYHFQYDVKLLLQIFRIINLKAEFADHLEKYFDDKLALFTRNIY